MITAAGYVRETVEQLPQLPEENVLGEPLARSTAVAVGLASVIARRDPDEVCLALPADHFVADEEAFRAALREAVRAAERGYLVVLGIPPTHPATGYGYIKVGARLHPDLPTAKVERFVEKPDPDTARTLVDSGDYLWNAGIFAWRDYSFRQALERFQPDLFAGLQRIAAIHRTPGWMGQVREVLEKVPAITIDVGIAEPAAAEGRMAVVPLEAGWSDIGSWHLDRGSERILVHGGERLIVTVGLEDVIIVDTPDALLVCARDRAEEIKPVLDEIAETAGERYL